MIDLLSCNVFIYFIFFTYHYHHYPSLTLYYFIQWKIFYIGLLKSFLMWYSLYIHFMLFTLLLLIVILSFLYKFIGFISHLESSFFVITIFFFMNFLLYTFNYPYKNLSFNFFLFFCIKKKKTNFWKILLKHTNSLLFTLSSINVHIFFQNHFLWNLSDLILTFTFDWYYMNKT